MRSIIYFYIIRNNNAAIIWKTATKINQWYKFGKNKTKYWNINIIENDWMLLLYFKFYNISQILTAV